LTHYFDEMFTPQGKIDLHNGSTDLRYKGKSKEEGTLYDELAQKLLMGGIQTSEAIMIGDKPWSDINPAKERGFTTIQYIGYINYGSSKADFVIFHFPELIEVIKGVNK
jgi:FMN phosphatase YigB (HAD superfamily)